jgi:formylglycine-generating enzyme required for sulfatase activity
MKRKTSFQSFSILFLAVFLSVCSQPQSDNIETGEIPVIPETPKTKIPTPSVIRGNKELSISWSAEKNIEYEVWYGTDNNSDNTIKWNGTITKSPPVAETIITNLENGITYYIWIKTEVNGILSDFSIGVSETPELPPTVIYDNFVYITGGTVSGSDKYTLNVTVPIDPPLYMNAGKTISKKGVFVEGRTVSFNSFFIAKYETTRQLWYEVQTWAESNGYNFQNKISVPNETNKNKPITNINWRDAIVWCNAYSEKTGLEPIYYYTSISNENILRDSRNENGTACDNAVMTADKNGFRLPTEIEREYTARGGNPGKADWMFLYSGSNNAEEVAWHHGNSAYQLQDIGLKNPNRLGVFDMSGNVQEWGWDWMSYNTVVTADTPLYGETYSSRFNQKPMAGGGVGSNISLSCVADRWGYGTNYKDNYVGFRLVQSIK